MRSSSIGILVIAATVTLPAYADGTGGKHGSFARAPVNAAPSVIDNPGLDRAKQLEEIEAAQMVALGALDERLLPMAKAVLDSYDSAKLDYHQVHGSLSVELQGRKDKRRYSARARSLSESLVHIGNQIKFDRDRLVSLCGEIKTKQLDELTPASYAVDLSEISQLKPLLPEKHTALVDLDSSGSMASRELELKKKLWGIKNPWDDVRPYNAWTTQEHQRRNP